MDKKVFLGIAVLAVILGGAAISLIPLTLGAPQSTQQVPGTQYYPAQYGPRWRFGPNRYAPYSGYGNYGLGAYPWGGYGCPGMGWGYGANPYWQQYPPLGYWNYTK